MIKYFSSDYLAKNGLILSFDDIMGDFVFEPFIEIEEEEEIRSFVVKAYWFLSEIYIIPCEIEIYLEGSILKDDIQVAEDIFKQPWESWEVWLWGKKQLSRFREKGKFNEEQLINYIENNLRNENNLKFYELKNKPIILKLFDGELKGCIVGIGSEKIKFRVIDEVTFYITIKIKDIKDIVEVK